MNPAFSVPEGYKMTEVRIIPGDWKIDQLGRFWAVMDCKHVTAPFIFNGYPLASIKEVQSRFIDLNNSKQTTQYFYNVFIEGGRKPQSGDIILSRNATVGEVSQVAEWHPPFAMRQDVCLLRKKSPEFSTEFPQAVFQSPIVIKQLSDLMVGSTFKRANVMQIRNLAVPMPVSAEQQAIADALSDADALVESLEQLLAKNRQIKQGAMQELLTGQKRLPGFSGEWKIKSIKDIASIQRGASPRPIDNPIWFDENSSVGWVRISDVTSSSMFLYETTQRLSMLGVQYSRPVKCDTLIMSICATVGRPVITKIDTCIHDGFVVFENLSIDKTFLYYSLKFIEGDWAKHGQTGSQMNLNTPLINRTEISVPPSEEQTAIATILSTLDSDIAALQSQLVKARQIKQGMAQELLTGRIRLVSPAITQGVPA